VALVCNKGAEIIVKDRAPSMLIYTADIVGFTFSEFPCNLSSIPSALESWCRQICHENDAFRTICAILLGRLRVVGTEADSGADGRRNNTVILPDILWLAESDPVCRSGKRQQGELQFHSSWDKDLVVRRCSRVRSWWKAFATGLY
jgi:hypothetical protein